MATEKETKQADEIAQNYEDVNILYITLLAEQVGNIQLGDFDVIAQRDITNQNLKKIRTETAKAQKKSIKQATMLIDKEARKTYAQMSKYYKAKGVKQIPFKKNRQILNTLEAIKRTTAGSFRNISGTTARSIRYQRCIDKAILSVQSGSSNYQQAINKAVRQTVKSANKIEYASGYRRRVDTAVRMNILDGVRQVQMEVQRIAGEQFGADGVEIDAHGLCAEDHIDIQGRIFACEDYGVDNTDDLVEAINTEEIDSDRGIGQWNCQHEAHPIVVGVSKPSYSEEDLEEMRQFTEEPIPELNGMNRRDASQKMRQIETKVREDKEELLQAKTRYKITGQEADKKEVQRYERKIAKNQGNYDALCSKAGLKPQKWRMQIHA